ncbi:MAG: hypothetical protein JSU63_01200 [Phycisphaerales bacterium]|nr:MAG: hypothetical protein JSU63_01200 [Phycisphaerales bacterium]
MDAISSPCHRSQMADCGRLLVALLLRTWTILHPSKPTSGDPKPQAHWTWVDLEGQGAPFYRPQAILNVGDLNQILFGLQGRPYSWAGNNVDPGDCP